MLYLFLFFFNDTATTEIYTLSLHDALPILENDLIAAPETHVETKNPYFNLIHEVSFCDRILAEFNVDPRSEEHTSELQSQSNLVCRLLLEKKKNSSLISPIFTYTNLLDRCQ